MVDTSLAQSSDSRYGGVKWGSLIGMFLFNRQTRWFGLGARRTLRFLNNHLAEEFGPPVRALTFIHIGTCLERLVRIMLVQFDENYTPAITLPRIRHLVGTKPVHLSVSGNTTQMYRASSSKPMATHIPSRRSTLSLRKVHPKPCSAHFFHSGKVFFLPSRRLSL